MANNTIKLTTAGNDGAKQQHQNDRTTANDGSTHRRQSKQTTTANGGGGLAAANSSTTLSSCAECWRSLMRNSSEAVDVSSTLAVFLCLSSYKRFYSEPCWQFFFECFGSQLLYLRSFSSLTTSPMIELHVLWLGGVPQSRASGFLNSFPISGPEPSSSSEQCRGSSPKYRFFKPRYV